MVSTLLVARPVLTQTEGEPETEPAGQVAETGTGAGSLVPDGEEERMSPRPVGQDNIGFKPGEGLEIKSDDGDFSLRTRVRVQLLYTVEKDSGQDPLNELQIRRARVVFNGNAFGKHNNYKLEIDVLSSTPMLDYYLDFTQNRDISVRVGQYKLSSNRQRVISSGNLQMVDRSIMNAEFTLDRDLGIDIRSRDFLGKDRMRYVIGVSMGDGRNNHSKQNFEMLYLVRLEYLPMGDFADYDESDFERSKKARLALGAAYAFFHGAMMQQGNIGSAYPDGGTSDYHFAFVDAIFKVAGFSAMGEFALRTGERDVGPIAVDDDGNPVVPSAPRSGLGWMLQAGYLIPRQPFEVVARYSSIYGQGSNTSLGDLQEAAFGINWYFARHPFKIQADVAQIWGAAFETGDTRFRLQLQASL